MKIKNYIYILLAGFMGLITSCEKDETKSVMLDSPVAPSIQTMPGLTLVRNNGSNTLTFVGTSVNTGFSASATYVLEACTSGTSFAEPVTIYSGTQDTLIQLTVSALNTIFLKKFDADATFNLDFRIRATLIVDAGTGSAGTSSDPFEYTSPTKTVSVTTYGLPKLNVLYNGEIIGKVESALGDGNYSGYVKLDTEKPFTLKDPDSGTEYGYTDGVLNVDGNEITPTATGYHYVTVSTTANTYSASAYMIGLVGSATANGWDSPDQKMDYDSKTGTWYITATLVDGDIKFRLNDGWAWNLGGTTTALVHNGSNITVTAGTYLITLTITNATSGSETGTYTMVEVAGK